MKLSNAPALGAALSLTLLTSVVAKSNAAETAQQSGYQDRGMTTSSALIAQGTTTIITEPGATETVYEKKSTTVDGVTTTTETTTTKVVPGVEVTTDVFATTLEGRRLQLENAIAAGQAAGTISSTQAKLWRVELDAIARAQSEGRTSLTYTTALPLAMSLDYLGNAVTVAAPTLAYVPLISGQRFIVAGGRVIMLDDMMVRRAELESKISRELALGHISSSQAGELRRQMTQIAIVERDLRSKDNNDLTPKDGSTLYKMFDKVGSKLDDWRKR